VSKCHWIDRDFVSCVFGDTSLISGVYMFHLCVASFVLIDDPFHVNMDIDCPPAGYVTVIYLSVSIYMYKVVTGSLLCISCCIL
jgi:hypothetical protein